VRLAAVWVPDWPVLAAMAAADIGANEPTALYDNRRITAVSAAARAQGVRRGMRRRQAQACCPELQLLTVDEGRDVRAFEPVVTAVEQVVSGVEVVRPGLILLPVTGAARYHGGEAVLVELLVNQVTKTTGYEVQAGIADGTLAAVLAARAAVVVAAGESAAFLASWPVLELSHMATSTRFAADLAGLVDLWQRLGIYTLGDLAALPAADIAARFGRIGAWAHRLASGGVERPPALRQFEADLSVEEELEPPVDRVDIATFAARRLAEQIHTLLTGRGLACARLRIVARTDTGLELSRSWRTDASALGGLTADGVTDRVRWQLAGWLTAEQYDRPSHEHLGEDNQPQALVYLGVFAEEVIPAGAEQGTLWGDANGKDLRAHRALLRVQGLLGADAVLAPAVQGGRDPRDQIQLAPWGQVCDVIRPVDQPWPGRLPAPAPATVLAEPVTVAVLDSAGRDVEVNARLEFSGLPAQIDLPQENRTVITGWAGPWPLWERWWQNGRRRVQLQLVLADGRALLVSRSEGTWQLEAIYD
jgi:protein ImuB